MLLPLMMSWFIQAPADLCNYGCPDTGQSLARVISHPDEHMWGEEALGGVGDLLLLNDRAAFIVQGPQVKSYYAYSGTLIDAVALHNRAQSGPERFGEMGLLVASVPLGSWLDSDVRAFRGTSFAVVNDGHDGGPAHVRVEGVDDTFWLIEDTLIREKAKRGKQRGHSRGLGLVMSVDYILAPDSKTLVIDVHMRNTAHSGLTFFPAATLMRGHTTDVHVAPTYQMNRLGAKVDFHAPWLLSTSAVASYALSFGNYALSHARISGVDAFFTFAPHRLSRASGHHPETTVRYVVSVGEAHGDTAINGLAHGAGEVSPRLRQWSGLVTDRQGVPLAGFELAIEAKGWNNAWRTVNTCSTKPDGSFAAHVPAYAGGGKYRIRSQAGDAPLSGGDVASWHDLAKQHVVFDVDSRGSLVVTVRDRQGAPSPGRVTVWQNGQQMTALASLGASTLELNPGPYEIDVTRGYEYTPFSTTVVVQRGRTQEVQAILDHVVDSRGFLSTDTHVHATHSADCSYSVAERIAGAAAAGLEVLVGTDHEIVTDWGSRLKQSGAASWVATVNGEEITATLPEHINMFPVPVRHDLPRGGPVNWYGRDIGEIYAAARTRGAGIVQLNHPKTGAGCNYLCLLDWDRKRGGPGLDDSTVLGFSAEQRLWSWDFDAVEVLNGLRHPFSVIGRERETGMFDDWLSFINHGHGITAMGVTDAHDGQMPGFPRTYFAAPTDAPSAFTDNMLTEAVRAGRAFISAGAFARVEVQGAGMGDTVAVPHGQAVPLRMHIEALPEIDVAYIKVFANCDEVATVPTSAPDQRVKYDGVIELSLPRDAHVVTVGFGNRPMPRGMPASTDPRVPRFITNPIYVDVDGNGRFDPPGGKSCVYRVEP